MYEESPTDKYISRKFRETSSTAFEHRIEKQEKQALYEIKMQFQKALVKLNDKSTKALGFRELQNIVLEHRDRKCLRLYISLLFDRHI
jgi:hypothetical protein